MKIQPAVRTETVRIAMGTAFFSLVMLLVFALLDRLDVTVVLGTLLGAGAAVLNFFLMALSVQRAAESMKGVTVPPEPLEENGEKVKAVLLKETFDSPAESDMMISMLAAYGIPCFKYYEKEGGAGKVINGFSGYGASLYVPQTMLEDAQNILNAEAVEEDENDAELHE